MTEGLVFRIHALQRMFERSITDTEVREALRSGKVLEDYPDNTPYPSSLILGYAGSRALHIVAARNEAEQETIIITVYEPDLNYWQPGFEKRREK